MFQADLKELVTNVFAANTVNADDFSVAFDGAEVSGIAALAAV